MQQQALSTSRMGATTSFRAAVSPRFACCCGDRHNCPHWLCTRALCCRVSLRQEPFPKSTWLIQFSCRRLMQLYWSTLLRVATLLFLYSTFQEIKNSPSACFINHIRKIHHSKADFCFISVYYQLVIFVTQWEIFETLFWHWRLIGIHLKKKKLRLNRNAKKWRKKKKWGQVKTSQMLL